MPDWLQTTLVTVLGGGGFAAFISWLLGRRKLRAEAAQAEVGVGAAELGMAERLNNMAEASIKVERIHNAELRVLLDKAEADLRAARGEVDALRRGEASHAAEVTAARHKAAEALAEVRDLRAKLSASELEIMRLAELGLEATARLPGFSGEHYADGFWETLPVGAAYVSKDGRWMNANPKMLEILGYDIEELRKKTFADVTVDEDVADDVIAAKRLSEHPGDRHYTMRKRYRTKDGEVVWVRLLVTGVWGKAAAYPDRTDTVDGHVFLHFISIVVPIGPSHETCRVPRGDGT